MGSKRIVVEIEARVRCADSCPSDLWDVLRGDDAEDYLYDLLCSWLWRYVPATTTSFDLIVSVTALERG